MAGGMMGYGQAMGSGKAAGETPGGIKPPKLPTPSSGQVNVRQTPVRAPGGVRMQPPPTATPIKQPPQAMPATPMSQAPAVPTAGGPPAYVPTTRESRLAAAQKLYAPDGAGWASMGGPPPSPQAGGMPGPNDPWGGFGSGMGQLGTPLSSGLPPTGGGFMAPGPPQQADPMQLPPELMSRIQMLMQSNPQILLRALGMA